MSATAELLAPSPAGPSRSAGLRFELKTVERRMYEAAGLDRHPAGTVQLALKHHLESGGGRTRAKIGVSAGNALSLHARDTVAIAAAAELLHNASLIHDDLQDGARTRRGERAVWSLFGANVAICAGDALISAAYSVLAANTDPALTSALVRTTHDATARVIDGQARDLALQGESVSDFDIYQEVAGEKSGPLLGLPLELALTAAGFTDYVAVAREAASNLAIAYQIADDLEDEQFDIHSGAGCLNAAVVLRNAGYSKPRRAAFHRGVLALREALRLTMYLPSECGEAFLACIEAVNTKLREGGA